MYRVNTIIMKTFLAKKRILQPRTSYRRTKATLVSNEVGILGAESAPFGSCFCVSKSQLPSDSKRTGHRYQQASYLVVISQRRQFRNSIHRTEDIQAFCEISGGLREIEMLSDTVILFRRQNPMISSYEYYVHYEFEAKPFCWML